MGSREPGSQGGLQAAVPGALCAMRPRPSDFSKRVLCRRVRDPPGPWLGGGKAGCPGTRKSPLQQQLLRGRPGSEARRRRGAWAFCFGLTASPKAPPHQTPLRPLSPEVPCSGPWLPPLLWLNSGSLVFVVFVHLSKFQGGKQNKQLLTQPSCPEGPSSVLNAVLMSFPSSEQ